MIETQFIPYELALELKELGFDERCFGGYDNNGHLYYSGKNMDVCPSPLWQQAFAWFRSKYDLGHIIYIDVCRSTVMCYFEIINMQDGEDLHDYSSLYSTYEEAQLCCLKKLIEIVKQK